MAVRADIMDAQKILSVGCRSGYLFAYPGNTLRKEALRAHSWRSVSQIQLGREI
jgi:hypothetical protein